MDYVHTLARATQKAIVSAHNEFRRELYTHPRTTTAQVLSVTPSSRPQPASHAPLSQPTPTITKTELNQLRKALYN